MYNGEVNLLSMDPAIESFNGRFRLNIRFLSDGSALTPLPAVRTPSPGTGPSGATTYTAFSVDETANGPHDYVFTISDDADGTPLFRSPLLTTLPVLGQNHNGAFQVILAAASPTFATLNSNVGSSLPFTSGSTTITGVTLAASSPVGKLALTAVGSHVIGPLTFPFTYTATLNVSPDIELFTDRKITSTSVSGDDITFSTPFGAGITPTIGLVSPAIAFLLRDAIEPAIDSAIDSAIRSQVATQLGFTGALPSTVTITLQGWNADAAGVNVAAAIGGVMPVLPPQGAGCGLPVVVWLAGTAGVVEIMRRLWSV